MLMSALQNSELQVVFHRAGRGLLHPVKVPPGTGLVYPHPDGRDLSALSEQERPPHLVLIDGTWSQAHRLYQDNPWLQRLPHYSIRPAAKSRYLIRREPREHCLSTLEAAAEALRYLEPDLPGLDDLLALFDRMNTDQVTRRESSVVTPREKKARSRASRALPSALADGLGNIVIVHGQSSELLLRTDPQHAKLFQGSALRPSTAESFCAFVQSPRGEPRDGYLERLGLGRADIASQVSQEAFDRDFAAFLRPADVLMAWNTSAFALLPSTVTSNHALISLKAAYCNVRGGRCGTLDDVMRTEGLVAVANRVPGRSGKQLSGTAAVARLLATSR
jgi:DTW domain-containing protein